jgi:hypothetical protein
MAIDKVCELGKLVAVNVTPLFTLFTSVPFETA